MAETLKPCPFCGGKATVKHGMSVDGFASGCWVSCDNSACYKDIECTTYAFATKAEAIEAWNRRAERTCRMDEIETGELADYRDTDEVIFHCMSCHTDRGIFSYDEDGNVYSEPPKYCPNCGAKITSVRRLADLISPCGGRASEVDEHDARHSNQDSCHQSSAGCCREES